MAETTGISWTDATFNPWIGCEKVSPGCAHCYAETLVTGRMGRPGTWGAEGVRERTSESNWRKPIRWDVYAEEGRLPDGKPNRDGHRPRVFCASLADVFEPRPELEPWRADLFDLIARTPSLDWQILTKRPEEAKAWLRAWYETPIRSGGVHDYETPLVLHPPELGLPRPRLGMFRREGDEKWTWRDGLSWGMLPNVWLGVSIENARHTWRADVLREIPAAIRFISAEPLLGSLFVKGFAKEPLDLTGIDWLIVGGESGQDFRPMDHAWARELRDACADTGTAFFFKQDSGRRPGRNTSLDRREWHEFPVSAPVPSIPAGRLL